jgi:hypothetical protein
VRVRTAPSKGAGELGAAGRLRKRRC